MRVKRAVLPQFVPRSRMIFHAVAKLRKEEA